MSLNNSLPIRVACDGESSSGKSTAAKLISKRYKLFCMNSGLLFRYASFLIIYNKPKKIIPFLKKKFKNLKYKKISNLSFILMIPYLLWCIYALTLNTSLYILN